MKSGIQLVIIALLVSTPVTAIAANSKPRVSFEAAAVIATVTPGASTAWFALSHERNPYELRIVDRTRIIRDDDRDGVVRMTLTQPSAMAFFLVVDLSTGEYDTAVPPGYSPRRRPLQPKAIQNRPDVARSLVLAKGVYALVWLARPGVGAWEAWIIDGSTTDGDRAVNGRVTAFTDAMRPIGGSPPPPADFQSGDIVAVGDPLRLHIFDVRVTK